MRTYVLDAKGNVVPEPNELRATFWKITNDTRVAKNAPGGVLVSTIFTGIDLFDDGPPKPFETCVFLAPDDDDPRLRRYGTKAEAEAGHKEVLAEVVALLKERGIDPAEDGPGPSSEDVFSEERAAAEEWAKDKSESVRNAVRDYPIGRVVEFGGIVSVVYGYDEDGGADRAPECRASGALKVREPFTAQTGRICLRCLRNYEGVKTEGTAALPFPPEALLKVLEAAFGNVPERKAPTLPPVSPPPFTPKNRGVN